MEENRGQNNKEIQYLDNEDKENWEEAQLEDFLENVPPEQRKTIEKMMISSSIRMGSIFSPEAAVMEKLTPAHISMFLDGAEAEMQKSYAEKFHRKINTFLTMVVANVFFIILVILLKDNPDVMEKIIYIVGGVVIGAFGGYGYGRNKNNDNG